MTEKQTLDIDSSLSLLFSKRESKTLKKFIDAEILTIKNLLNIWPNKVIRAPSLTNFECAKIGELFRGKGTIIKILKRPSFVNGRFRKKIPLYNISAVVQEELTLKILHLHWFNSYPSIIKKLEGLTTLEFQGEVREFNGTKQINNPTFDIILQNADLLFFYPTVNGISPAHIKNIIDRVSDDIFKNITDMISASLLKKNLFPDLSTCYLAIHARGIFKDLTVRESIVRQVERRFSYDYFLDQQLKLLTRRSRTKIKSIPQISISNQKLKTIIGSLDFELTADQDQTLKDIINDFQSGHPMMRLLQGDVGCGKTAVAFLACAINFANKNQSAIMCPTETLAEQHYYSVLDFAKKLNIRCQLWTGGQKNKDKKIFHEALRQGDIDLVIGTHALIQPDVQFKNLSLVVIDEQHKFGVKQRLSLSQKAETCHTLTMTATPIPRSLSLIQFGDLDVSIIKQMPKGRKGYKTKIIDPSNFLLFLNFLKTRLGLKEQAYIVVPAILENEGSDLLNLEKVLEKFKNIFPEFVVSGLHGKLKSEEKSKILHDFVDKKIHILVATSVVEVGINNLNASIMAIMNPERFGLSSLHQLRGRVGRGILPGFCFLICDKKLSDESILRLKIIEKSNDGFEIAEEDLKIRGHGNLFGTDQSGDDKDIDFQMALKHLDLLEIAKKDAENIFKKDNGNYSNNQANLNMDLGNKYHENPLVIQTT